VKKKKLIVDSGRFKVRKKNGINTEGTESEESTEFAEKKRR
jgi:hypothetical protein